MRNGPAHLFRVALAASLTLCALLYFLWSWRWPLVGDASLIHYIGYLHQARLGTLPRPRRHEHARLVPDRDRRDASVRHGRHGLAFLRLHPARRRCCRILRHHPAHPRACNRDGWLAGLFAACLFILVHGRDGLAEGGQHGS